jgi:serine phosphatase RsbU (regulator of sigma subunit)
MAEIGAVRGGGAVPAAGEPVAALVQEILAVIPAGCTWLVPVFVEGRVVDFRVAAASDRREDIYQRGSARVDQLLSQLYPTMVGGPLWQLYLEVVATGGPERMQAFRYEEKRPGVVAESTFDVSVYPVLGGLLVWWQRVDESQRRLERTELLGSLGWAEYDLATGRSEWSPGMYRLFEREPALGPMSRAEQAAAVLADDHGLAEAAWQTLDSGATSDVTVRFRTANSVKSLRILSEVARDADATPLKVYALVQDVTAREASRTAIERLRDQLRTREITALAEHRLAAQLQNMIQPVPSDPLRLEDLEVLVGYLPAESALQVGGDWYHAQTLADGKVVLAIGDVAGHGLEAANGMAHLRFALIGWLSIGIREPETLLAHMNNLSYELKITGTAVVAIYDPATRTLRWAGAGHMPPLLSRSGTTDQLEHPPSLLLGAAAEATYAPVTSPLQPHDLLLLYTDGLVERRGQSTAVLLDTVTESMSAASAHVTGPDLSQLQERLHYASPDDDTCTVAVRVLP